MCALVVMLIAFQIAVTAAASTFLDTGDFERLAQLMPSFFRQALGPVIGSFDGMILVGYVDGLIVMLFVQLAIYLATEPAAEIESSLVDLVLARALPRHWVVSRSVIVMVCCTIALAGAMAFGTWLGLVWLAPDGIRWPATQTIATLTAHLTFTAWCFGGAALAASGWARRRGAAQAAIAVSAVLAYLLDLLSMMWASVEPVARLSPFHYFRGANIVAGTADSARDLTVLGTLAVIGVAVAYWRFQKRDL
jgi:hypothetical protein